MVSKTFTKSGKTQENQGSPALNPDQERAVRAAPDKPLLIVAGAGTGKTATLTSRVAFLIKEGVPPASICAITFTNKAAREMEERIVSSFKFLASSEDEPPKTKNYPLKTRPFIGTFHAFGARILRRHAALLGRTPGFVIFDDHDSFSLVKKILKDMDRRKESPAIILGKISALKNTPSGDQKAKLDAEAPLVQSVFARYEAGLEEQNAFDFDDLLAKVVLLFHKAPAVLDRYRAQFTHILIDEYQDLNDLQYEFTRLLVGDRASISVVGDAEQTIYGWRGSNIEIFLRFPDDWAEAHMVTLDQNYRSTRHILRAASGVIQNNVYDTKVQRATGLWTENAEGKKVVAHEALGEDAEAEWIAEQIGYRLQGTGYRKNADTEPGSPGLEAISSTAILYRTNAQSRALEQALLRRRIPYRVYGGLKFYERREIKDIVAALRYSLNPKDQLAQERLEKNFSKRMFRTLADAFANHPDPSPLARIDLFLKTAGYFEYMERNMTNPRERRENIEELVHFAAGYKDIAEFLGEIALLQSTDNLNANGRRIRAEAPGQTPQEEHAVSLMTIHLAKGLEFDRVFVAGVVEGVLPHARSMGSVDEVQEERRLMYVAMTRARKELYLSFYELPSRFLGEVPEDTLEFQSETGTDRKSLDYDGEEYEERYISLD